MKIVDHLLYFGYLISQTDSARWISLVNTTRHLIESGEVRLLASSILIAPYFQRRTFSQSWVGEAAETMVHGLVFYRLFRQLRWYTRQKLGDAF